MVPVAAAVALVVTLIAAFLPHTPLGNLGSTQDGAPEVLAESASDVVALVELTRVPQSQEVGREAFPPDSGPPNPAGPKQVTLAPSQEDHATPPSPPGPASPGAGKGRGPQGRPASWGSGQP